MIEQEQPQNEGTDKDNTPLSNENVETTVDKTSIQNEVEDQQVAENETTSLENDVTNSEIQAIDEDIQKLKDIEEDEEASKLDELLHANYDDKSKHELYNIALTNSKDLGIQNGYKLIRHIEPYFSKLSKEDREKALEKYLVDGGDKDSFEYRNTDDDNFYTLSKSLRSDYKKSVADLKDSREKNLKEGKAIVEAVREILQWNENEHSINKIRELQTQWKVLGQMPTLEGNELYKNYKALLDLYYDNRSIFFDLKDLDRKKNLEKKILLCEKAEALVNHNPFNEAFKILRQLHEDYKQIGPVPREESEKVWLRFKEASDVLYSKRKEIDKIFDAQREENLEKKKVLLEKIEPYKDFVGTKFSEWGTKSKEVQIIQKEWEAIGPLPKNASNDVSKAFWAALKSFFNHKNQFYKESQKIKSANLEKKQVLVDKAISLKDSTDWRGTADVLKKLQKDWKEIGPVPEEVSDKVYKAFNTACNTFFENLKKHRKDVTHEFKDNLKAKRQLIDEISALAEEENPNKEAFQEKVKDFVEIGFVPKNMIEKVQSSYDTAFNKFLDRLDMPLEEKAEFTLELDLMKIKAAKNPDRLIQNKEHDLRKKVNELESEISLWNNNMAFFKSSNKVQSMKDEFEQKIALNQSRIDMFKQQIRILRKLEL